MNKLSLLIAALLSSSVLSVSAGLEWVDTRESDAKEVVKATGAKYDAAKDYRDEIQETAVKKAGAKYDAAKGDLNEVQAVKHAEKTLKDAKKSVKKVEAKLVQVKKLEDQKAIEDAEKSLVKAQERVAKAKVKLSRVKKAQY